jgi:hypothetical protein
MSDVLGRGEQGEHLLPGRAIAGLFLVLVVGDVQAREDETYRASVLAEIDVMSEFEFEKYVAAAMQV